LVGEAERNTSFSNGRRVWDDDNIMDLKSISLEDVDWIYLAQDRNEWPTFVNVKSLDKPRKSYLSKKGYITSR